jgi:chromatin remodeling complex protein RSC6
MADITMETIYNELAYLRSTIKTLATIVRKVRAVQDDPTGEKAAERSKNNSFNRPNEIDMALREFLGLAEGEMTSRGIACRAVNQYAKDNGLKHPENARILVLDDKLQALLDPPEGVQVTVLTIQKYLSPHFIKKDVDPVKKPVKTSVVAQPEELVESSSLPEVGEVAVSEPTAKAPVKKMIKRPVVRKVVEA